MEKKIREYEEMIEGSIKKITTNEEKRALAAYHQANVCNFQHERLIHLLVTFFFAFMAVVFVLITIVANCLYGFLLELTPLYLLTMILVILTGFYVKHYYFLENHVQDLYKYTDELYKSSSKE